MFVQPVNEYQKYSQLYAFLIENRCFIKDQNGFNNEPQTHLPATFYIYSGYKGGVVHVPDEIYDTCLYKYACDINDCIPHYLSEQKSPVFKMHADFDILSAEAVSNDTIFHWVAAFNQEIAKFYPEEKVTKNRLEHLLKVVVLTRDSQMVLNEKSDSKETLVKDGVHLVWPNLYVNSNTALWLRQAFIECMVKDEGQRQYQTWEELCDELVYTNNGLRMPYSKKVLDCKYCHNDKNNKKNCGKCLGQGRVQDSKWYTPKYMLDYQGDILVNETNRLENINFAVTLTSIRLKQGQLVSPGFTIYENATPYVPVNPRKRKQQNNQYREPSETERAANKASAKSIMVPPECQRYKEMLRLIREVINPDIYHDICPVKMWTNAKNSYYIMTVRGGSARYCQNLGRRHKSQHVYFYLDYKGISQKCWDEMTCGEYRSPPKPITRDLKNLFFDLYLKGPKDNIQALQFPSKNNKMARLEALKDLIRTLETPISEMKSNKKFATPIIIKPKDDGLALYESGDMDDILDDDMDKQPNEDYQVIETNVCNQRGEILKKRIVQV